jgi:hypothetical protein
MRQPVRHPRLGSLNFILTRSWSRSSITIHARHRAPNQRRLVRRWLERVSCRVPVVQRERGRFLGGEYPVGSTGTELRSRKIWSGCARQAQGVPSAHIIRGSARFAECGLRAWPMGPAPPPPASRCGRPPHPTARFEGHVMRRNHPPVRRLSGRQRISCLKQVSAPTSSALVGVSVLASPIIMFCDVKQV